MRSLKLIYIATVCILLNLKPLNANAQYLMDLVDTTKDMGKGLLSMYKKWDGVRISGYLQPQLQFAEDKGAKTFEGGNFSSLTSNRLMFRRSRIRLDYINLGKPNDFGVQFVFQFDANERGFTMRDIWGRITENKYNLFSATTGMFARPFGFEVNYSSSDRESPERGRMSQLLMKGERDLGVMFSLESRRKDKKFKHVLAHVGLFNGQGINATGDFDNKKDIIARAGLKQLPLAKGITLSTAASILYGGLINNTKYVYNTSNNQVTVDSSNVAGGSYSPRQYYGADAQLKFANKKPNCFTELRGEYVMGTQTGTANTSETPASILTGKDGYYVRNFSGAYLYFLQHIFSPKHQVVVKYDVYDPNTKIAGNNISTANKFTEADVKFQTLGLGYVYYMNPNTKATIYYARTINEKTALPAYTNEVKDDVLTLRLQFRF